MLCFPNLTDGFCILFCHNCHSACRDFRSSLKSQLFWRCMKSLARPSTCAFFAWLDSVLLFPQQMKLLTFATQYFYWHPMDKGLSASQHLTLLVPGSQSCDHFSCIAVNLQYIQSGRETFPIIRTFWPFPHFLHFISFHVVSFCLYSTDSFLRFVVPPPPGEPPCHFCSVPLTELMYLRRKAPR